MTRPAYGLSSVIDGATPVISICESDVPLERAAGPVALAVIIGTEGPSYRPVGAVMVVDALGQSWGSLSSGCVEHDVILHAQQALADGQERRLRYGEGSAFRDLVLPCGGGLDIAILPHPDPLALREAVDRLHNRCSALLDLGPIRLQIVPQLRFVVMGRGPEMHCFTALAGAAGFPVTALSPDPDAVAGLVDGQVLRQPRWPAGLALDHRTAITLFFHDHGWEPALLKTALQSPAIYVGAQGSLRAHQARCTELAAMGVPDGQIARLASPFGMIPSARDPRTLAASVLAQVLETARLS